MVPAQRSAQALRKVHRRTLDDGSETHSLLTLLAELSGIVRNRCRLPGMSPDQPDFYLYTTPNPKQQRALDLVKTLTP